MSIDPHALDGISEQPTDDGPRWFWWCRCGAVGGAGVEIPYPNREAARQGHLDHKQAVRAEQA